MRKLNTKEIVIFAFLGVIIFASKMVMEFLPNIHLIAPLIIAYTIVFRKKALVPIFVFIILTFLVNGFTPFLLPYIYVWPILWGVTMLLPKNMSLKTSFFVYIVVAGLHGFLFGTMYAPMQAIMFGLNFKAMVSWIVAGVPFDLIHGVSNIIASMLTIPLINILKKSTQNI